MKMTIDPGNILSPKQLKCYRQANGRVNLAHGSVRAGKSVAIEQFRWPAFVLNEAGPDILFMVGRTLKSLERNVLLAIQEYYGSECFSYSLGNKTASLFGRRIELEGANDSQARAKIVGATVSGVLMNEMNLFPEDFVREMLARMSNSPGTPPSKAFATCNPDSPYHYLKTDFIDNEAVLRASGSDFRQWHFHIDDNEYLDDGYRAAIKAEYGSPSSIWYKRAILGLWVLAEGAIYDMFNEDKHTVQDQSRWENHAVSVDYGTSNPCTFGLYGWNGSRPPARLIREYWYDGRKTGRQKTDSEYADDMMTWLGADRKLVKRVYVDPSAASFIAELKKRKLPVRAADNSVIDGIRFVSSLLHAVLYSMHKACKHTIENYQAYVWDSKAQKAGEDKPIKEHDHACDRDRYFLYSEFGKNRIISGARQLGRR